MSIETEEKTLLRGSCSAALEDGIFEHPYLLWCPSCLRQVEMVTPERAALIVGVTTRTIYRWIEACHIHFREERGHLFVCHPTLSRNRSTLAERAR